MGEKKGKTERKTFLFFLSFFSLLNFLYAACGDCGTFCLLFVQRVRDATTRQSRGRQRRVEGGCEIVRGLCVGGVADFHMENARRICY